MAEIPENSRLFRKPEPPKKELKRSGSGKLTSDKRASDFGRRISEYGKRTSEIVKRASEFDDGKQRYSALKQESGRLQEGSADSSLDPINSDDAPPLALLFPARRISGSQNPKPPRSKISKTLKPLATQRRAQPGRDATEGSRRSSLTEIKGVPGRSKDVTGASKRSSLTEGKEATITRRNSLTQTEESMLRKLADASAIVDPESDVFYDPIEDPTDETAPQSFDVPVTYTSNHSSKEQMLSAKDVQAIVSDHRKGATLPQEESYAGFSSAERDGRMANKIGQLAATSIGYEPTAGLEKVVVAVRVRPLTDRERACATRQAVVIQGPKITLYEEPPREERGATRARDNGVQEFTFDLVQNDSETTGSNLPRPKGELQEALFQALGQQCLDSAIEGYNVTMFAYGQTGAGKSFSMMGDSTEEGAGIIPRLAKNLLQRLKEKRNAGTEVTLQVTYLEIYSERVRDLLASTKAPPSYFQDAESERDDSDEPSSDQGSDSEQTNVATEGRRRAPSLRVMVQAKLAAQRFVKKARKAAAPSSPTRFSGHVQDDDATSDAGSDASEKAVKVNQTKNGARAVLKIREHPDKGPYVEGLTERHVSSWAEMAELLEEGSRNRTIAATDMNKLSSRSHTVFTLTLTQTKASEDTGVPYQRVSKINLVDLAGSERQNRTNATGARLKESGFINRSLSLLNDVITELARGSDFVPYRNSSLTWLLKESLGGNSKTVMVASISPAEKDVKETLSTLRYANRAKRIKNKPVLNEDPREILIKALRAEIDSLRALMVQHVAAPEPNIAQSTAVSVPTLTIKVEPDGLRETTFGLSVKTSQSITERFLESYEPDSPSSSMLTPVEGFSPRVMLDDAWDTVAATRYRSPWDGESHAGSPQAKTLLQQRRTTDRLLSVRQLGEVTESEPEAGFAQKTEAKATLVSTASDAFVPDSVSEGTEAEPRMEGVECATETPEVVTEGTEPEPGIECGSRGTEAESRVEAVESSTETVPLDVRTDGTETDAPAELQSVSVGTEEREIMLDEETETVPAELRTAGTETEATDLMSVSTEADMRPTMLDEASESIAECSDAQNETDRVILCDSVTYMERTEVASISTETELESVNAFSDTEDLIAYESVATGGEQIYTREADCETECVTLVEEGTSCEAFETTSTSTETENPSSVSVGVETEPEPETEVVHVSAPQSFEGLSTAISSASPFLVQLLLGSDCKQESRPEKGNRNGIKNDKRNGNGNQNNKLAAGLQVLRQLGIAVDEGVLLREGLEDGLAAHALEDGGKGGLRASWAVHLLAPGVNSIGSNPSVGLRLPGRLQTEHVELVLAPPSGKDASSATVIARSIRDAPALLNGAPLPRFAELSNGDCLLLGDPSALGDGSGDAALFYFFNPLCNVVDLTRSVGSPCALSSARARPAWSPVESPGQKLPLGVLLRPLDVRPHGQEAATWSPEDDPVLDVGTWAFILGDELQRSGSVSNNTVKAFLEDVRTGGAPGFVREHVPDEIPPPVSTVKLPRSPRGLSSSHKGPESPARGLSFGHKGPESPRSPSFFQMREAHHSRAMFH